MPIRVKTENSISRTWARRDSRDSLSSADHLIAVYSLESKDPSFDAAAAAVEMNNQKQCGGMSAYAVRGGTETTSSSSWVKNPWAVCFPPQLQANVQQISERLKLEPPKLDTGSVQSCTQATTSRPPQGKHKTNHKHKHAKEASSSVSCGYEFEHKEDRDGNVCVLHIEQSDVPSSALAFPDDDSVCSWTSQNAVKFNKKLKPKAADSHCVKEPSTCSSPVGVEATELTAPPAFWETWGAKQSEPSTSVELNDGRKAPKDNPPFKGTATTSLMVEKRDEIEASSDPSTTQARHIQDHAEERGSVAATKGLRNEKHRSAKPVKSLAPSVSRGAKTAMGTAKNQRAIKKSVCFTNPLVTSQHFRPKTRPEEVSLLYFDEDELEILEDDRETTSRDQFEMIAQELSENRLRISIAYQNRWRDRRERGSGGRLASSPSSGNGNGIQVASSTSDP